MPAHCLYYANSTLIVWLLLTRTFCMTNGLTLPFYVLYNCNIWTLLPLINAVVHREFPLACFIFVYMYIEAGELKDVYIHVLLDNYTCSTACMYATYMYILVSFEHDLALSIVEELNIIGHSHDVWFFKLCISILNATFGYFHSSKMF